MGSAARRSRRAVLLVAAALHAAHAGAESLPLPEQYAACVACRADPAPLRAAYSDAEWSRLLDGEVLTSEERGPDTSEARRSTVTASGLIAASPEQVWVVITDHAAYPRFMPTVRETVVRPRADGRIGVRQHLRILFLDVRFATVWELDPAHGLARWQLDESEPHDIASTAGSWQLAPLLGEAHTLARYRALVDTGQPVPGPIERLLTRSSLPRVIRSVRGEVERRYGATLQ